MELQPGTQHRRKKISELLQRSGEIETTLLQLESVFSNILNTTLVTDSEIQEIKNQALAFGHALQQAQRDILAVQDDLPRLRTSFMIVQEDLGDLQGRVGMIEGALPMIRENAGAFKFETQNLGRSVDEEFQTFRKDEARERILIRGDMERGHVIAKKFGTKGC